MMTLKDIKVSKNPIPVQNAMWLRPLGGFKFKLYYPQGATWTEITTSGGEDPHELDEIERRLTAAEQEIEKLEEQGIGDIAQIANDLKRVVGEVARIALQQSRMQDTISSLRYSISRLYSSVDLTVLVLTKAFNMDYTDIELIDYGIDEFYLRALQTSTAKGATMPGYTDQFSVITEISWPPTAIAPVVLLSDFILLTSTKYTVFRLVGTPMQMIGTTPQIVYHTLGSEFTLQNDTVILSTALPREAKTNQTMEFLEQFGITFETIQHFVDHPDAVAIARDSATIYHQAQDSAYEENDYFEVILYQYDEVVNKTYTYSITGGYVNSAWIVDMVVDEDSGNYYDDEEEE